MVVIHHENSMTNHHPEEMTALLLAASSGALDALPLEQVHGKTSVIKRLENEAFTNENSGYNGITWNNGYPESKFVIPSYSINEKD